MHYFGMGEFEIAFLPLIVVVFSRKIRLSSSDNMKWNIIRVIDEWTILKQISRLSNTIRGTVKCADPRSSFFNSLWLFCIGRNSTFTDSIECFTFWQNFCLAYRLDNGYWGKGLKCYLQPSNEALRANKLHQIGFFTYRLCDNKQMCSNCTLSWKRYEINSLSRIFK